MSASSVRGQIVADFINNYNPARERCWIADERRNRRLAFVVQASGGRQAPYASGSSPSAGLGLAPRLVQECIRFAGAVATEAHVWTTTYSWPPGTFTKMASARRREEHHSSATTSSGNVGNST